MFCSKVCIIILFGDVFARRFGFPATGFLELSTKQLFLMGFTRDFQNVFC